MEKERPDGTRATTALLEDGVVARDRFKRYSDYGGAVGRQALTPALFPRPSEGDDCPRCLTRVRCSEALAFRLIGSFPKRTALWRRG